MLRGLLLLIATAGCLLVPAPAPACTCMAISPEEALDRADAAFVGRMVRRHDPNAGAAVISSADPIYYTFAVDLAWQGVPADTVVVRSARNGASCGMSFQPGVDYAVFARERDGELRTGICSGNRELQGALDLRFQLPAPHVRRPGAVWQPVHREDLLDLLGDPDTATGHQAGQILAADLLPAGRNPYDLGRLLQASHARLTPVLREALSTGRWSAQILAAPVSDLTAGENDHVRNLALCAQLSLASGDDFPATLKRFLAAADNGWLLRGVMTLFERRHELTGPQARASLQHLQAAYSRLPLGTRQTTCQILREFPDHAELLVPFARAVRDTSGEERERRAAEMLLEVVASQGTD